MKPGKKKVDTLLDLCVSSLRRGHANLLCIVPILTDVLFRGSVKTQTFCVFKQVPDCQQWLRGALHYITSYLGFERNTCTCVIRTTTWNDKRGVVSARKFFGDRSMEGVDTPSSPIATCIDFVPEGSKPSAATYVRFTQSPATFCWGGHHHIPNVGNVPYSSISGSTHPLTCKESHRCRSKFGVEPTGLKKIYVMLPDPNPLVPRGGGGGGRRANNKRKERCDP